MENQNNNIMQTQNTNNTSTIDESTGYIKNNIFNKNHSDDSFFLDIEKDIHINKDTIRQKLSEKRRIGNVCAFFYKDGEPRIIIGPHCIFYLSRAIFCLSNNIYKYYMLSLLLQFVEFTKRFSKIFRTNCLFNSNYILYIYCCNKSRTS